MTRYIVRPSRMSAATSLSLAATRIAPASRERQITAVRRFRMENSVDRELRRWMRHEQAAVRLVSVGETHTRVTGTTVLDMQPAEAERLKKEVPGLNVIEDKKISLIVPRKAGRAAAGLEPADLWHLQSIGLADARSRGIVGTGEGVVVAVLDTGVHKGHPEIRGKVPRAFTFDVDAWRTSPQSPARDTDGHGTHVAGLVCGSNVGVAPGARVYSGVMIPNGGGTLADFILALEWAASVPEISVINMSAGIPGFVAGMEEVIADVIAVGVVPIIATGNEGRNRTRSPGNYNSVLSVGASNASDKVATFSSGGSIVVDQQMYTVPDLVAPGERVTSCVMTGGYEPWDGTSMATPVVSGVAALMIERHPGIGVLDLVAALIEACKDLGAPPPRQGAGLVQVTPAHRAPAAKPSGPGSAPRKRKRKARRASPQSSKGRRPTKRRTKAKKRSSR